MKAMIDTNIFLDVMIQREPFFSDSKEVLDMCEKRKILGFLSASSVTDLFYIIHRHYHSSEITYRALGAIMDIAKILPVTSEDVLQAYLFRASDFEDCLLAVCAVANRCDVIITRNKDDFSAFGIDTITPEELLERTI